MPVRRRTSRVLIAVAAIVLLASCSGSSGGDAAAPTTGTPTTATPTTATPTTQPTTTTPPAVWKATNAGEHELPGDYRQGIAKVEGGWLITTNNAVYRTNDDFVKVPGSIGPAIPDDLAAQGYNHIGDGDVHDGTLWVPLERDDKSKAEQVTARYDAATLRFVDSFVVPQHHNAFVTVADDGSVYSMDEFSDKVLMHYVVKGTVVEQLEPIALSRTVEKVQGADLSADGAIWLSTNDDTNGIYRVDPATGSVQVVGTAGHISAAGHGEGEGIDVTDLPTGLLHVIVADEKLVPMWAVDFKVTSAPA